MSDPAVKSCTYCHVKNGNKALNPTGECYGIDAGQFGSAARFALNPT